ncbi:hypothetical protein [Acanthopleuribacter pedis]|uniref:Uncharacterized protein n=1 Tax=Acanthopleuribacter pedis TaxID=442870 RepID=A0A8J7U4Q0_9BACT|nr:hypothetical protein [Acanthopleuribacter pedis]MBO1321708.1 hypothetical protein [Acanthopleuribacter pedis]
MNNLKKLIEANKILDTQCVNFCFSPFEKQKFAKMSHSEYLSHLQMRNSKPELASWLIFSQELINLSEKLKSVSYTEFKSIQGQFSRKVNELNVLSFIEELTLMVRSDKDQGTVITCLELMCLIEFTSSSPLAISIGQDFDYVLDLAFTSTSYAVDMISPALKSEATRIINECREMSM